MIFCSRPWVSEDGRVCLTEYNPPPFWRGRSGMVTSLVIYSVFSVKTPIQSMECDQGGKKSNEKCTGKCVAESPVNVGCENKSGTDGISIHVKKSGFDSFRNVV